MSSIGIIFTIILLLAALVCYAFIVQTIKQKTEQRNRLIAALKARLRNFKFMLNGFPTGFLPRDLTLLVQRSLIETCENLTRLEPKEPSHLQDLQAVSAAMAETQRHPKSSAQITLENPQQIKEVKVCLQELYRFIHVLEHKNTLSRNQAENYRQQVRQMVLQLTVDKYVIQATMAMQSDKTKLAIHYYDLAVGLLEREGKPGQFESRINELKTRLNALIEDLEEKTEASEQEQAEKDAIADEWESFGSESEIWKKKHAYD